MKTAMQELIDDLKQLSEDKFNDKIEFTDFIKKQEQLIEIGFEKEKEQIKTAFESGWNWNFSSEKYYNETYGE